MKFSTPYFKNGVWISNNEENHVEFMVVDDECRTKINESVIQFAAENAGHLIEKAFDYAMNSVCRKDILENGGIIPDSIIFPDNHDAFVWFSMPKSSRMVGVRITNGVIASVYIDHP